MRILMLTHAFNSLAQRIFVDLVARGHEVSVELDIGDSVTREAVELYDPELIVAPFLKRMIPESVWRERRCFVVHPGIVGDRGPSSLDWAILDGEPRWGATVIQANDVPDGGDVWAWREFGMRPDAAKGSLYRDELGRAASAALLEAIEKLQAGGAGIPAERCATTLRGVARPSIKADDRRIDWVQDTTADVLRKIRSADGRPGVPDRIAGLECRLFNAHAEGSLRGLHPGEILAVRDEAICRATTDGAIWITHLAAPEVEGGIKLPAARVLGDRLAGMPRESSAVLPRHDPTTWQDLWYEERDGVGFLAFELYNGAMSTRACERARDAFVAAARQPVRVIVLLGGRDFWSNGLDLNVIEASPSPADESWRNINAMDDLCRAILECGTQLTVAAMRGNAGAGGVFLALAADRVIAREGITLNPHYKGMGNLYGSEYWTYLLPKRVGWTAAHELMQRRLPMGTPEAARVGLVDEVIGGNEAQFRQQVEAQAAAMASGDRFAEILEAKREMREADAQRKPLAAYRDEELARMRLNFYGFDPSYHVARYHFVHKVPHAWTPLHLALHRRSPPHRRAA